MPIRRLRRMSNIKTTLAQHIVLISVIHIAMLEAKGHIPSNSRRRTNVMLMLGRRRRQ